MIHVDHDAAVTAFYTARNRVIDAMRILTELATHTDDPNYWAAAQLCLRELHTAKRAIESGRDQALRRENSKDS